MPLALIRHRDSPCAAVTSIDVEVVRPHAHRLVLDYVVTGTIDALRMPPTAAPARKDELWRHTCFEAFIAAAAGEGYYEFNFAPSGQWAAYRFTGYRSGMAAAAGIDTPVIAVQSDPDRYTLQVKLALDRLPDLPLEAPWRLGLSAVIEETGGRLSYWALAHPPGQPDFHHADCFAQSLSSA